MRQARRPTRRQKDLIERAGLEPEKWLIRHEDNYYLHLVDKGLEQRQLVIIDKAAGEVKQRALSRWRQRQGNKQKNTTLL